MSLGSNLLQRPLHASASSIKSGIFSGFRAGAALHRCKAQVATAAALSAGSAMTALEPLQQQAEQMTYAPEISWEPEVQAYLEAALGVEALGRISKALARPPLATCLRVNTLQTTPQELISRLPAALTPEDAALLAANPPYVHPLLPDAIILPGTGPHQIDYSRAEGRVAIVGRKCGESVMRGAHVFAPGTLAVSQGMNAGDLVAVCVGLELPGTERYAYTRGTVLGSEHEAKQLAALGGPPPDLSKLFIGLGRAELNRTEFFQERGGVAITMQERVFRTPGCGDMLPGQFMLQNLCSLLTAHVLAPKPGSRVLDMCAAPGGKTTAIAQLMRDQGEVIAFDRSHSKASEVRRLAESFGLTCVQAYKMDASKAVLQPQQAQQVQDSQPQQQPGNEQQPDGEQQQQQGEQQAQQQQQQPAGASAAEAVANGNDAGVRRGPRGGVTQAPSAATLRRLERIAASKRARGIEPSPSAHVAAGKEQVTAGFPPNSFDYVLCDAPCTALGLRPRLVHRQTLRELQQTAQYQRKILAAAVQLVKPGGTLVFSTCSINPGENEANVRWLLDSYPGLQLVPQQPRLGQPGISGTVTLPDGTTQQLLSEAEAALVQRFDPSAELDTIGFFIAKFLKIS